MLTSACQELYFVIAALQAAVGRRSRPSMGFAAFGHPWPSLPIAARSLTPACLVFRTSHPSQQAPIPSALPSGTVYCSALQLPFLRRRLIVHPCTRRRKTIRVLIHGSVNPSWEIRAHGCAYDPRMSPHKALVNNVEPQSLFTVMTDSDQSPIHGLRGIWPSMAFIADRCAIPHPGTLVIMHKPPSVATNRIV